MGVEAGRRFALLWLCAVSVFTGSTVVMAAPVCTADRVVLASASQLLADRSGDLTVDEVMRLPSNDWQPVINGKRLPVDSTVRWLKIGLANSGNKACRRWLVLGAPTLRDMSVYAPDESGWRVMHAGALYPVAEWALPERQPVFPITLAAHATTTILARVPARGAVIAFAPALWAPESFQRMESSTALRNGLVYGGVLLLLLVSLLLSFLYKRPQLTYMALAVGFYAAHKAAETNYLYYYLWPDMPQLNMWLRYFFIGMFFAMACRYICTVLQLHRVGRWWPHVFLAAQGGFVFFALFSSIMPDMALMTRLLLRLDQVCRLLFVVVLAHGLWRGVLRGWFPSLLVGLVGLQGLLLYGHWFVPDVPSLNYLEVFASMVLGGGMILLTTLVSQVYQGRRGELLAQAALVQQRASENERLQCTVIQRTEQLSRALHARRQLLGHISHDLRSPLAAMLDSARLWRDGDTRRDYPRLIERHAGRQMELIDELLEFSGTELAVDEVEPVPGYLYAFLMEVADTTELAAEHHGNHLHRHFAADLPAMVRADFRSLRRVLANLLGNAAKYTRDGDIHFTVDCLHASAADSVRLHFIVDDNGPGMTPGERQRLLQPFARGGNVGDMAGSGLGLAIVSTLLEHMGSCLEVDESPMGGSRLHFELILALTDESELEPVLEDGDSIGIDGDGYTLLVVDDDAQQRELTCDLLGGYGFDTLAAADGREALDRLQGRPVDLILTDQAMPGLGGWGLLQAMRRRQSGLPVILYSGLPPLRPAGLDSALVFDAVLLKPATAEVLLRRLVDCLDSPLRQEQGEDAEPEDVKTFKRQVAFGGNR